jgi:endonuclease G
LLITADLVQQTQQRFDERAAKRNDNLNKLKGGTPLQVDTPDRVERRVARLAATEAMRDQPAAASVTALERVLGKSDLMSVNYLEIGLQAARCVGRVTIRSRTGQTLGFGTSFTISPQLLLTNNHVLDTAEKAEFSRVEFNFQEDAAGNPLPSVVLDLEPRRFFLTDKKLDFTVVAVANKAADGTALRGFCWLPLIEEEGKVLVGEYLNIIQHPNGEPKQLALRENQLIDLLSDYLHYKTDTAPGSSGSPVLNDQWEVVALHHSGVPKIDAEGRTLTVDGTVWREEMGEHRIHWLANEGVRVSRIVKQIKQASLNAEQDRLRREMFEVQPSLVAKTERESGAGQDLGSRDSGSRDSGSPGGEADTAAKPVISGGDVTWTIPLQVSVRLGSPAVAAAVHAGEPPAPKGRGDAAAVTPPSGPTGPGDTPEVQAALREAREAQTRTYYDEAADQENRDAYYADIDSTADKKALFHALSRHLRQTHTSPLPYKPMQHVYPWVDLHPDGRLRSIYSGKPFEAEDLIREDARIEAERVRLRESFRGALAESLLGQGRLEETLDLLEAQLPFNCEHVVPQSWFAKREPMRGDLHHLFACETGCNSFRGNIPYFDFPDFNEALRGECGKREEGRFEPANGKGAVARSTLYFLLRYPGEINAIRKELLPERIDILLDWHARNPPSEYERHRNASIFEKHGNRNPVIDFPEWASRIDFSLGLGD